MSINRFTKGYFFLSNFYPSFVVDDMGIQYPSMEHAYQAAKSLDRAVRLEVKNQGTPGESKRMGGSLVLRKDWEEVKQDVMEYLLRKKFSKDSFLSNLLLETGNKELTEGNYHGDKIWGVCLKTGEGTNFLGKILMKIRKDLSNEIR